MTNTAFKSVEPLRMKFLTFHFGKNTVGVGMVYSLTNDFDAVTYTCEKRPTNHVQPGKVRINHQAFGRLQSEHHNYMMWIATITTKVLINGY